MVMYCKMRSLAKKLLSAAPSEGRPAAFYWQYGWADCGFFAKNTVALTKGAGGSPTRRMKTRSVESDWKLKDKGTSTAAG